MNLTIVVIVAAGLAAGGFYAKGQLDASRRATLYKLEEEKENMRVKTELARRLQEQSALDAMKARQEFAAKKEEADELRKELEERGKVVACRWSPSQRERLRKIPIGREPTSAARQRSAGEMP